MEQRTQTQQEAAEDAALHTLRGHRAARSVWSAPYPGAFCLKKGQWGIIRRPPRVRSSSISKSPARHPLDTQHTTLRFHCKMGEIPEAFGTSRIALSALAFFGGYEPKALPWAGMSQAVGLALAGSDEQSDKELLAL